MFHLDYKELSTSIIYHKMLTNFVDSAVPVDYLSLGTLMSLSAQEFNNCFRTEDAGIPEFLYQSLHVLS